METMNEANHETQTLTRDADQCKPQLNDKVTPKDQQTSILTDNFEHKIFKYR